MITSNSQLERKWSFLLLHRISIQFKKYIHESNTGFVFLIICVYIYFDLFTEVIQRTQIHHYCSVTLHVFVFFSQDTFDNAIEIVIMYLLLRLQTCVRNTCPLSIVMYHTNSIKKTCSV